MSHDVSPSKWKLTELDIKIINFNPFHEFSGGAYTYFNPDKNFGDGESEFRAK
jgi:hypothetical protein